MKKGYTQDFIDAFDEYYKTKDEIEHKLYLLNNSVSSYNSEDFQNEYDKLCREKLINQNKNGFNNDF